VGATIPLAARPPVVDAFDTTRDAMMAAGNVHGIIGTDQGAA
jgi:hypothetical protein